MDVLTTVGAYALSAVIALVAIVIVVALVDLIFSLIKDFGKRKTGPNEGPKKEGEHERR